jgi:hypothetical protein
MTTQFALGNSDTFWRRVFHGCQGLLIGLFCIAFLADFFARSVFSLDLLALGFPTALVLLAVAVVAWVCRGAGRRRWYQLPLLVVWLLLFAGIYRTNWPMRWSFGASTSALDRLAERVAAGQTPSLPTRAGAYLIRAVDTRPVSGGVAVCLWSYPPERHHIGFVQRPRRGHTGCQSLDAQSIKPPLTPLRSRLTGPKYGFIGFYASAW